MERVLVVDDSLTVRMDLAEALSDAGFDIELSPTIASARARLAEGRFALAILDVLLPDGNGVDLLRELRAEPTTAAMPVMLLSTEAEVSDRVRGLSMGAHEYVGKPYDRDAVVARAHALVVRDRPSGDLVLVIDDSPTYRDALRVALEAASYRVVTAGSGEEGLQRCATTAPNAIIVDGQLPGMDGPAFIRRVRLDAALRRTPCLLLTGADSGVAELTAFDAGADAFIRKGHDVEEALLRLAAVLRTAGADAIPGLPSLVARKRVLAVDDSLTYLEHVASQLRADGFEVIPARSGEEALRLLAVQTVDCILLDRVMPGLDGNDTCRRIKAAPVLRDIPLVMLTAHDDRMAMIEGLDAGADDYIAKSSDLAVLKARVLAQIRRKQIEDENRRVRDELVKREIEARDARAAHELAEARAVLLADLERKNRELEAFSYSVSHDLRAPLRSIDGFSLALLEDHGGSLDGTARGYLSRVRSAAQRMGELIDDLLELSRVGRTELVLQSIDLAPIARNVAESLQRSHPDRSVRVEIAPHMPAHADSRLMRIVFENLLGNAWKFTANAGEAEIEIGLRDGASPSYFVRDNGVGFDMQYVDKLFSPFQRLHAQTEFSGTGIGLATIARIIDRHGGRVSAEGVVGVGATFSFTLSPRRSE